MHWHLKHICNPREADDMFCFLKKSEALLELQWIISICAFSSAWAWFQIFFNQLGERNWTECYWAALKRVCLDLIHIPKIPQTLKILFGERRLNSIGHFIIPILQFYSYWGRDKGIHYCYRMKTENPFLEKPVILMPSEKMQFKPVIHPFNEFPEKNASSLCLHPNLRGNCIYMLKHAAL